MNRSPLFNFVAGIFAGAALSAVLLTYHYVGQMDELKDASDRAIASCNQSAAEQITRAEAARQAAEADAAQQRSASETAQKRLEDPARPENMQWYTLLYDPDASAASDQPSPLELLDLVRPGLGTALARLHPPAATAGGPLRLHWVLPGRVQPVVIPDGSHSVWSLAPGAADQVQ